MPIPLFSSVNGNGYPSTAFGTSVTSPRVYDTWSLHYESNGVNEDSGTTSDLGIDTATDGLDNGTTPSPLPNGLVDDVAEYDTQPPYAAPLKGIRIKLRVYEPQSQQVREAVIIQNFRTN